MPRRLVVQLAFAVLAVLAAPSSRAQDRPDAPKPETLLDERARARKAPTLLRALIGLTRYQGEKKVASVPYTVLLTSDSRKVRLRMGVEVPIAVATFAKEGDPKAGPVTSFQYRNVGTNIDQAMLKVNSRLQQVPEYPIDADQPVITTSNASARAIAWFILSPLPPTDDRIREFIAEHPDSKEALDPVLRTDNIGLKLLRLKRAVAAYPAADVLTPAQTGQIPKLKRFAEDEIEARFEQTALADSRLSGHEQHTAPTRAERALERGGDALQLALATDERAVGCGLGRHASCSVPTDVLRLRACAGG